LAIPAFLFSYYYVIMKRIITNSEQETFNFAKVLASRFKGGEIIGLTGELGSGKTVFVKGFGVGLGIKSNINSPTFNIMKIYNIPPQNKKNNIIILCHIDAYRLTSGKELAAIGANEYFSNKKTITIIEWAEIVKDILPASTIFFKLSALKNNKRQIARLPFGLYALSADSK
jgi:tRNA threonylcarbamoyladenosine biosynthesis protein TsaE